ncbi:probable serine/threonine-protein kinase DDB_G0282963 [Ylistrum balloti]|uniref:probable serine/threonine-protein kinase DDB_G0282963 n=1 Tax=Ylistrum balloti TaxID=509963 RepID=UPI002905CC87|nr:probable serine/threonine-protein kinase DDB_G0282963 [Ylistrum balloti]
MPESAEEERGGSRLGSGNRATPNSASQSNISAQLEANRKRIGSAKYYDIASTLMGKGHTGDLEELFLAAARDGDYDKIENFLLRSGKDHLVSIDVKDKRTGNTSLIWAAKRGHTKIVQLLLKHGADITLRNYEGQTAVEVASASIKTLLLDSINRSTESSHRLLLQAAWQGNIRVLNKLLNENKVKDINCKNAEGLTPLLLVARDIQLFERLAIQQKRPYNPAEVVTSLLAHRADIHAVDEDGKTCLHYSSQSKASLAQTVVQALITGGPDIDLRDKRLFAPIHCASQSGNTECVEVLINGGSGVNCRGFAGTTPLHITAYNDNERTACCLLKYGADVTLTDDRGLTPMDLARGKKMKTTLKEAWAEAIHGHAPTNLAPVKAPSRQETRTSLEDLNKSKKGGEVIFDNMPSNPFANMKDTPSKGRLLSRHLSLKDKEKARRAEELMRREHENSSVTPGPYVKDGMRRLGMTRNQHPSPLPKGKGYQRLPAISPDRMSIDRNQDCSSPFTRNSRFRRSLDETRLSYSRNSSNMASFPNPGPSKRRMSPLSSKDGCLTPLSFDYDSGPGSSRLTQCSPTLNQKPSRHQRSGSDTLPATNLAEIAASCDPFHKTGRSVSMCQPLSQSDDFGDACLNSPRLTPLRTPLERGTTGHVKPSDGHVCSSNNLVLDLDRMGLLNKCQTPIQNAPLFPTSSKILPPTPTMMGEKAHSCLESCMTNTDWNSKDPSPRSDDEIDHKKVKQAFQNSSSQLLRSPSIFKQEFILEESRPKDILIHSSGSDLSSTGSKDRSSVSSDEMMVSEVLRPAAAKPRQRGNNKRSISSDKEIKEGPTSYNVVSVNSQNKLVSNLRTVESRCSPSSKSSPGSKNSAKTNSSEKAFNKQGKSDQTSTRLTKDKVVVHTQKIGTCTSLPSKTTTSELTEEVMRQNILNAKASEKSTKDIKCAKSDNRCKSGDSRSRGYSPLREEPVVGSPSKGLHVVSTKLLSNVKEEVKKQRMENSDTNVTPQVSSNYLGKENVNNSDGNKQVPVGNPRKASRSPARRSDTVPTANKGNNSTPSYLNPTQSSVTRRQTSEGKVAKSHSNLSGNSSVVNDGVKRSAGSSSRASSAVPETLRKSTTTLPSNRGSQMKSGASVRESKSDVSVRASVPQPSTSSSSSYKPTSLSSQNNPQPSNSASKSRQTSGVRKSQSDPNVPQESSSVASIAVTKSGKDNGSKTLKSTSLTTLQEAKNENTNKNCALTSRTGPQRGTTAGEDGKSDKKTFQYKPASAGKGPLVEIISENSPRVSKPKHVESQSTAPVQTPVIVNPFEDMRPYNGVSATSYGYTVGKPSIDRSKTQTSMKSRGKSAKRPMSKDQKPASAGPNRQGKRRGDKSKEGKQSDEGATGRPRSGKNKRTKSGKKKKKNEADLVLSKQASQSDVALISGIGWHVATHCVDTSDVTAVKRTDTDSSDSSDSDSLDNDTPREGVTYKLRIPNHPIDPTSNSSTPRFLEVKPQEKGAQAQLPVMSHDGYRPMNLDMTQASFTPAFGLYNVLGSDLPPSSSQTDLNSIFNKMDGSIIEPPDVLPTESDEAMAEIHRNILMGKLTPIPESPSLKSGNVLHKTIEAIEKFDHNIQAEMLSSLLGVVKHDGAEPSPRVDLLFKGAKNKNNVDMSKHISESVSLSNSAQSGRHSNGKKSLSSSSKERADVMSGASVRSRKQSSETRGTRSSSKERVHSRKGQEDRSVTLEERSVIMSGATVRSSLNDLEDKNIRDSSVIGGLKKSQSDSSFKQSQSERNSGSLSSSRKDLRKKDNVGNRQTSGQRTGLKTQEPNSPEKIHIEVVDSIQRTPRVPRLENLVNLENSDNDDNDFMTSHSRKEGRSTRRERRFSETKSEDRNDNDHENIEEVIEEILSNTVPSVASTLKSHGSLKSGGKSLASTFSEADTSLLKKLSSAPQNSPFHAKSSSSAVRQSGSYEDLSVPHPTNPNLLNSKVKAMADVDNEAKQIAKIMNSFKQMELYAGSARTPGTQDLIPKPETSSMEPVPGRKPPLGPARPSSAGAGKVRSAGRFTEIKNEKNVSASKDKSLRRSTDNRVHDIGFPPGDPGEQDVNIVTPDADTIISCLGTLSRPGSACTTISTQSSVEDTIQWKKGNVLGKGAFGTVWCGLTSEGQLIAVKQIELNTGNQDKAKREYEKVQEEVELLKTLNHKNIVGYLGTSLEENIVSIFMQFVPGGSIASILARFGALDEAVFRRYTKQVLEGVEYLHANDVIHRDIKGGNVMLMPNGIIKLIDFGCAKRLCINLSMGQSQILKSMKGTPFWMAPEVVNETGHGKKSDIWSVGCTIFEMATRKPPWADMNPMAAIFAIGSDKPVPQLPNKFSPDAISFVNACLTRDQNKRLSATQLLQHMFINKKKSSRK